MNLLVDTKIVTHVQALECVRRANKGSSHDDQILYLGPHTVRHQIHFAAIAVIVNESV